MKNDPLRKLIIRENTNVRLSNKLKGDQDLLRLRSKYRDDFEAHLPRVAQFLQKQKLPDEDVYRITAIIGELGNNSFDHNLGRWPNGLIGNLVILRYNKLQNLLEIVVIDLGIGFQKSLEEKDPNSEAEAIKMGLSSITGRTGEARGNDLRTVTAWMRKHYNGKMRVQSNDGTVTASPETIKTENHVGEEITGTEIYLRLNL